MSADLVEAERDALLGKTPQQRRAAIMVCDAQLLRQVLGIPEGAVLDAVTVPIDQPGMLFLRITGAGFPVVEGDVLQRVTGRVSRTTIAALNDDTERELQHYFRVTWDLPVAEVPS